MKLGGVVVSLRTYLTLEEHIFEDLITSWGTDSVIGMRVAYCQKAEFAFIALCNLKVKKILVYLLSSLVIWFRITFPVQEIINKNEISLSLAKWMIWFV